MDKNLKLSVFQRLSKNGRWNEAAEIKNSLIREARKNGFSRGEAHETAYRTVDAMYPPADRALQASSDAECLSSMEEIDADVRLNQGPGDNQQPKRQTGAASQGNKLRKLLGEERLGDNRFLDEPRPAAATVVEVSARAKGGATVSGLDLPESWPQLPPNASLGSEVAWVLANRSALSVRTRMVQWWT